MHAWLVKGEGLIFSKWKFKKIIEKLLRKAILK